MGPDCAVVAKVGGEKERERERESVCEEETERFSFSLRAIVKHGLLRLTERESMCAQLWRHGTDTVRERKRERERVRRRERKIFFYSKSNG